MEPVTPSVGWGVTHLYFRVRPSQSPAPGQTGPDLSRHEALARILGAMASLQPVYSFFSMTELSEYMETLDDVRARLAAQGVQGDVEERLAKAAERLAKLREDRLHPRLPQSTLLAFYPMSKAREPGANWYKLPFQERRELM